MSRTITAAADILILGTLLLSAVLRIYTAVTVFPLNPYWIELLSDYSGGFVRRFLLGEILRSIPGVSPETAGLILLTACYAFVTLSLYAGIRRLNLPVFLRILVLLSPHGLAFYLLAPMVADRLLLRDILIIGLVILASMAVRKARTKPWSTGRQLLCDAAVFAAVTFGMLCHSGILFCTPPLLMMYLGLPFPLKRSLSHAAVLGTVFLGEFLTINLVFGELSQESVLDIVDMFKSEYPGIPISIAPHGLLFSVFSVSSGGESYWVEMARQQMFSCERTVWFLAAFLVPCLILLFRFIRSGLGAKEYFRRNRLLIACSASAFSPVLMSVFSIDFLRWLAWSFILSSYFAMQESSWTEDTTPETGGRWLWPVRALLSVFALLLVIFYTPGLPSSGAAKTNFDLLVTSVRRYAHLEEFEKNPTYILTNPDWNWEWEINSRVAADDTENRLRFRKFNESSEADNIPEALESGCGAEFIAMSLSGRRLYLSGWEALESGHGDDGAISYIRPKYGMGFLIRHGDDMTYYPTMPLAMLLKDGGKDQNINYGFDDYLLMRENWSGGKITIYPAFLNSRHRVFYCSGRGRSVMLPPHGSAGAGVH